MNKEQREKLKEQREKITERVLSQYSYVDVHWWAVNQAEIHAVNLTLKQTFDLMCDITDMFDVDVIEYEAHKYLINVKLKVNS